MKSSNSMYRIERTAWSMQLLRPFTKGTACLQLLLYAVCCSCSCMLLLLLHNPFTHQKILVSFLQGMEFTGLDIASQSFKRRSLVK